jgi:hypothetical protein
MYQAKTNKFGNLIVEKRDKVPQRLGDNKEMITKDMYVIYRGVYVLNTDIVLEWGVAKNMIKPSSAKEMADAYFSYSMYMFENLDLENMAIPERMETSIRQMTLAHLKIQQLIAKLRPSGLIIDIDSLSDINIGQGKALNPLELQRIYDQTGNIYYRRRSEDGESQNGVPIQEATNSGSVSQIQELILVYNHYLDRLRDEIGVNEYREGAAVNPKLGLGVQQSQIQASNNATDFIYDAVFPFVNAPQLIAIAPVGPVGPIAPTGPISPVNPLGIIALDSIIAFHILHKDDQMLRKFHLLYDTPWVLKTHRYYQVYNTVL